MTRPILAVALLALVSSSTACHRSNPTCDKLVEISDRCDTAHDLGSGDEHDQALEMLRGMCTAAFRDDIAGLTGSAAEFAHDLNRTVRAHAECAARATTCAAEAACTASDPK